MKVSRPILGLALVALLAVGVLGTGWNVVGQRLLAPAAPAREGNPAPALNLPLLDGGSADLSRERGKVVLVNFWATWCEPCRAEMAGLQQLDHNLSADHFELYAVDLEETSTAITPFRQQIGFTLPVLLDGDGAVSHAYGVRALPATFIVDRSGIVRDQRLGPLVSGDDTTPWSQAWVEARVRQLLAS
ncbi:MAG: TlpA family protein disulfide reductase [Chloroflexi bacterium]|nr:TlpA family protein disulfide reductase [Chloroflexota bacterium]